MMNIILKVIALSPIWYSAWVIAKGLLEARADHQEGA